ncbi:hypothetical protein [Christensenella intestinihominis]|uniref:hypothetical protein n=1 Tax=Christensenella intestinihominis TaxID=1851429 RepID=UPI0008323F7F|nr:hypothetical protein [Christensenella intestinihominis]
MRIGIKYCGGCNPRYDRTNIAQRLREDFPEDEVVPAASGPDMDYVVVVCGCKSACALVDGLTGKYGRTVLTESDAYDGLLKTLKELQRR